MVAHAAHTPLIRRSLHARQSHVAEVGMPALKSSRQISTLRGSKWDGERCVRIKTGARWG